MRQPGSFSDTYNIRCQVYVTRMSKLTNVEIHDQLWIHFEFPRIFLFWNKMKPGFFISRLKNVVVIGISNIIKIKI